MAKENCFTCDHAGPCFGRSNGKCIILTAKCNDEEGKCKFQKPEREVTNGVSYPADMTPR